MRNDLHSEDLKSIWQNQTTEISTMSLALVRQKARELHTRTRRQLFASFWVPLVVAMFYVFCISYFAQLRQVMNTVFAFALAWSLAGLYFLNRGMRPGAMPADAGFSTGLEFCRQAIERQRGYFRRVLLWSFGPLAVAVLTTVVTLAVLAGNGSLVRAMPLMVLTVGWVAAYLVVRVRQQRKLQREADELSGIEKETIG
jgi:hypothetical protein